jgi:hypothetical protein
MSNFFEHIQDGISQLERQLESLMPDYVKVDERSPHELLQLLARLSSQFNYYDFQDRPDGTWEEFFHADLLVMLITATSLDFTRYEADFLRIKSNLHQAANDDELFDHTRALFLLLYDLGAMLMDLMQKLQRADRAYQIGRYVEQVMDSLEEDMTRLHRFEYQVIRLFPRQMALHEHRVRPLEMTHLLRRLYRKAFDNPGAGTEIFEGFFSLNALYDALRSKFYQVSSSASYYVRTQPEEVQHSPHMGLLVAFLELYKHLQEQINKVPKRHLDLYYRQILGVQTLPAIPDKVHVFLEPAPHISSFSVDRGEVLLATVHARKEPLQYILQDSVKVNNIKIMSLHTLFVSDYLQIASPTLEYQDIREAQAYLAVHPVIQAADLEKEGSAIHPWPLLGEDQHDLSPSGRTMMDTDIGFIIGSPVLYLEEGIRLVQVRLYCEPATFSAFLLYVKNFAQVSNRSESVVMTQLLSGAFHLYYTTAEGWEPVPRFSARCSMQAPDENSLEIKFQLDITGKPWITYDEKVHSCGIDAASPLLKVLLNNACFHHPYSFLRNLVLERVSVNVSVEGHKYFKIQNNTGLLSTASAFMLFGPQPYVGAYLDVNNSNVFNRFTRSFDIKLEWLNLPKDETGFESYYYGYDAGINNASFKVGISSLNNGVYFPERDSQQLLTLFGTTRDKEGNIYLAEETLLEHIDISKLSFSNDMLLEKERDPKVPLYKEGGIRLYLAAPAEAFGHRLFEQIYPAAVMYNSQHSLLPRKKKPVPNLPYAPLVKAISLDYTLEHTEALKSVQSAQQGDGLEVFHAMPSGFRKIYPQPGGGTFSLLPQAPDMASLCIGFNRLHGNEELSLLFQLEEKHYSDTVFDPTPLKWSYLDNNNWIPFARTHILSDDTNNMLKSGIVKLRIPADIRNGNTMLDPSLYWIRLSSEKPIAANPRVVGIFPNAVLASRQTEDAAQTLDETLSISPFSIRKFKTDIKPLQHVWQPFPSFGGRRRETETQYYTRVSERLRHKGRPVFGYDVSQVLLQEFPELLIVKCLNIDEKRHYTPEMPDVTIIVVPCQAANGLFNTLEPKVDLATLYRIQAFVQRTISPFVKAEIRNPVYERVKVVCKVRFNGQHDYHNENLYLQKLHDDIKRYLCPWLFGAVTNFKVGSTLYRSEVLNFINRLPYVEYVTAFSLVHFFYEKHPRTGQLTARITDTGLDDKPFIRVSVPEGVFIPSPEHLITVLHEPVYEDPVPLGILGLEVGDELLVGKDQEINPSAPPPADPFDEEMLTITIHPK